jgi:hypothetical protein
LFLGRHIVGADYNQTFVAMKLLYLKAAFMGGRGGRRNRHRQGYFVGRPLLWVSTFIFISDAV